MNLITLVYSFRDIDLSKHRDKQREDLLRHGEDSERGHVIYYDEKKDNIRLSSDDGLTLHVVTVRLSFRSDKADFDCRSAKDAKRKS